MGLSETILELAQREHRRIRGLRHRQQSADRSRIIGLGWLGLADGELRRRSPDRASMGTSDASTSQLVQAMAGFGGGAADTSNTAPLSTDTSQQTLLTTPKHA